jgi:hypothetical protein
MLYRVKASNEQYMPKVPKEPDVAVVPNYRESERVEKKRE